MALFESFPSRKNPDSDIDDYSDNAELYASLKRVPAELRSKHLKAIEDLTDEDALTYLQDFHTRREAAQTRFYISDSELKSEFKGQETEILRQLETSVFKSSENMLGQGQTADVKRFTYEGPEGDRRLAVKYLLRPREHTLKVDQEHDLLSEVEQLKYIEEVEKRAGTGRLIKVPHPYFYLQSARVQCYAMEEVDGVNLLQFRDGQVTAEMKEALREGFKNVDRNELEEEVTKFFTAMHNICLHGDIFINKPGNLMASTDGTIYVIDFGEATHGTSIDEQLDEFYKEESEKELIAARTEVLKFLDSLYQD